MRILVAGGGISGLATAYYLTQQASARGTPVELLLVEAGPRLGGKLWTEQVDGFVVEAGPDSFLTTKPAAVALCRDLGLGERLMPTNDARGAVFVLVGGRLHRIPDGLRLIAPTRLAPFLQSSLLTWRGKARMGLETLLPRGPTVDDESVGAFVGRRLGQEAVARLAQPLLAGIYMADVNRLSMAAAFPQFRAYEASHGSVIRGLLAARRQAPAASSGPLARPPAMFLTLRGGTQELVDALAERLGPLARTGVGVTGLARGDEGRGYRVTLSDGTTIRAAAVVLATPAPVSARLAAEVAPPLAQALAAIRHAGSATISLGYRLADLPALPEGFGFVVAAGEAVTLRAATLSSLKFDHRAPAGQLLLRAFVGGDGREADLAVDDAALVATVRADLARVLGLRAEPLLTRVFRWPGANPQYDVGHLARVAAIEAACPPGLYVTGAAYHGVGVPDCVKSAEAVARRALATAD